MNSFSLNSTVLNILRVYATALVFFCHSTIVAKQCFGLKLHGLERLINTPAWGGVWMFLAIGGFLASYGFDQRKYTMDKSGILKYYKGRIVKVLIPTYIFLSLMFIFNMQEADVKWTTILKWLTCTFNGSGAGIKNVGASWYVFIMMWLYLLVPVLLKWLRAYEYKHSGKELKSYFKLLLTLFIIGAIYRLGGVFLDELIDKTYYNWFYANVTGTIDIFLIGMIGERMMHYMPQIEEKEIKRFRRYSLWLLIITTIVFLGNVKYQSQVYCIIGAGMFAVSSMAVVMSFSYNTNELESKNKTKKIATICNVIAPYTFMFYLWHSPLLSYVADKMNIGSLHLHYFSMLIVGGFVTAYIAFLMTKMNNGVIKSLI